jgi:hypothetical protein
MQYASARIKQFLRRIRMQSFASGFSFNLKLLKNLHAPAVMYISQKFQVINRYTTQDWWEEMISGSIQEFASMKAKLN